MIDVYVDHSAQTAPYFVMDRRLHSASSGRASDGYTVLTSRSDSNEELPWIALFEQGVSLQSIVGLQAKASISKGMETERESTGLSALKRTIDYIYCNDEASQFEPSKSRVALRSVIDSVEDFADDREFIALDRLLSLVEPSRLRPITAVAFLRSSYAAKTRLRNWNGLYQVVYAYLTDIGENPRKLMRGLAEPVVENYA